MFEYFAVLRVAASSAADPASRAAAATYDSANGQITVTSQVSGFPLYYYTLRCQIRVVIGEPLLFDVLFESCLPCRL